MVISVVEVDRISFWVVAAMYPSIVVGDEGTNGGLWCSPVANTSSPTSSAFWAIRTMALIRSPSVGSFPVVGSGVTSPTEKIPNCIAHSLFRPNVTATGGILSNGSLLEQLLCIGGHSRDPPGARRARRDPVASVPRRCPGGSENRNGWTYTW